VDILHDSIHSIGEPFDLIVSNPPYVSREEFKTLQPEIREYEPLSATCDSSDGLTFYRRISEIGGRMLKGGSFLVLEVGFGQSATVQEILRKSGCVQIQAYKDYSGIERVVSARTSS
jgi:release factor glutamine methyltransferase